MNTKKPNTCKNQHIVPQFLQRKFSSNNKLWRHTLKKSFGVNINDNFSQGEYYSERPNVNSTDLTLDEEITNKESNVLSPHLNYLLTLEHNKEFNVSNDTSNFIYHFMFRNKQIIESLIEALENRFNQVCSPETSFKDKIFADIIMKLIPEFHYNNFICDWVALKKTFYNHYDIIRIAIFNYWFNDKLKETRELHKRSLVDNSYLTNFKFQIIEGTFILCDTVFIAYNSTSFVPYLPFIDLQTEHIFFPISNNKCLILYKECIPSLDNLFINESLVSGCHEFCSELNGDDPFILHLKNYINQNKINEELNSDINDSINSHMQTISFTYSSNILKQCRKKEGWKNLN